MAVKALLQTLGITADQGELTIYSPRTGAKIASVAKDDKVALLNKIQVAKKAQKSWHALPRKEREPLLLAYAAALSGQRDKLAELIHLDAGKTMAEGLVEVDGSAKVMETTIATTKLEDLGGMQREKWRKPAGVVGLITSFNFPMVVAHWTLAPALLAGNAVLWKPSEKTMLVALACKGIFDQVMGEHKDLLQLVICGRDIAKYMLLSEEVDMISATGSVAMGRAIKLALDGKDNNKVQPILELGGNNAVVISESCTTEHVAFAVNAITQSFFGTSGQRCTNTRRIIVHQSHKEQVVSELKRHIQKLLDDAKTSDGFAPDNSYNYGPLIDKSAYSGFALALEKAKKDGAEIVFGARLFADAYPDAYFVEPAIAVMPKQTDHMHEEVFGPLMYVVSYEGGMNEAMELVNAPRNAGLVNGIYTLSKAEANYFAHTNRAGHGVVNSPRGTGTPANGMGFGGNRDSGKGEILGGADPLAPFCRRGPIYRVAINKEIALKD